MTFSSFYKNNNNDNRYFYSAISTDLPIVFKTVAKKYIKMHHKLRFVNKQVWGEKNQKGTTE